MFTKCLLLSCFLIIINAGPEKFFRKGYKFLEETQSFYKIQTIHRSWQDAKDICELEGATLFYPQDEDEAKAVLSYMNSTTTFYWIYIGISTPNAESIYETVDGLPIESVYDNWAPNYPYGGAARCVILKREGILTDDVCDKPWPSICKKTKASLRWNDLCDIPNPEYTYNSNMGRCYKLHLTPKNWKDAYTTCSTEQSRLAVINSDEEAKFFVEMINSSPKDLIDGDYLRDAVHLGFKYVKGWKTYQGTDLGINGYAKWGKGQPDGGGNETCGSMFYNGLLRDVNCDAKSFFICEHEIRLLQTALDYKFGEENFVQTT